MIRLTQRTTPLVLALALAGCETGPTPAAPDADVAFSHGGAASDHAQVQAWIAHLRASLARYHQFDEAIAAGYDVQVTPCMELPGTGGMGFHYGAGALIDGVVEPLAPEVLLYEPQKNGRMRLVGVEFIVPFAAWTGSQPPEIHGIAFHPNATFQVWALHAWLWKENPSGLFADWNPKVTCQHAS